MGLGQLGYPFLKFFCDLEDVSLPGNCKVPGSNSSPKRLSNSISSKGAFTNYVYKNSIFLTTYPPPLVNVVCKRPHIFFRVRNLFSFASFESNEKIRFQELRNVWLNGIPNLFRVRIWKQPPIFHNLRNSVALIFFWVHRNKASNAKISRRPFSCCLL